MPLVLGTRDLEHKVPKSQENNVSMSLISQQFNLINNQILKDCLTKMVMS